MKILMTGANGQLGQCVLALTKSLPKNLEFVALTKSNFDITDKDSVHTVFEDTRPDIVLNFAAYTNVAKAEVAANEAYLVNDIAVGHLAKACASLSIPILHISTDFVFNSDCKTHTFTESDTPNPVNIYGKSKLAGEAQVQKYCQKFIILRSSWIISNTNSKNFYTTIIKKAQNQNELKVVSDQYGAPTTVESLAKVICKIVTAIDNGFKMWGIYHYCDEPATTWYELASFIINEQNQYLSKNKTVTPISSAEFGDSVSRPLCSTLNCQKIKTELGIDQENWKSAIKRYIHEKTIV